MTTEEADAAGEKIAHAVVDLVRALRPEGMPDRAEGPLAGGVLAGLLLGIWRRWPCGTDEELLQFLAQKMREHPRIKAVPPSEAP